jgi:3-methylcrotonyl-CoA carboxylase alpha subunit
MFSKLLIANRGEIACRVIRTARRMGIATVAVYSDADGDALHVRSADEAVHIGPAPARDSYLDMDRLLDAVARTGAEAVHPGYGFLAENAEFAEAVTAASCTFVGPSAEAIRVMGSKIEAKRIVEAAGAPVVPGYMGSQEVETLLNAADDVGYPLLIKASAGGGGKGMRLVEAREGFELSLGAARREAGAAFGDDAVLLERYLTQPKHLEVQVLADGHGNTVYLFERDCSVQRRHQKVIEEAPGPTVDSTLRASMGEAAVKAAAAIGYLGAGTIEFIAENDEFFFMEMNTRLQVEHPITEAIVGLDLVEWQLRVAAGEPLDFLQDDLAFNGHAIEARIYAENPRKKFLPSTGRLSHVRFPALARVDTGVRTGSEVTMHYDPMIAKVIVHGADRREAVAALDVALADTQIAGVEHNVAFLRRVLADPAFKAGDYDTGLIDAGGEALLPIAEPRVAVAAALMTVVGHGETSPWQRGDGFRLNLRAVQQVRLDRGGEQLTLIIEASGNDYRVRFDDEEWLVEDLIIDADTLSGQMNDRPFVCGWRADGVARHLFFGGATERFEEVGVDLAAAEGAELADGRVLSPMPGQIIAVHVKAGDVVTTDQPILVMEAMKMEHTIVAPKDGTVARLNVRVGDRIEEGGELVVVE